MQLIQTRAPRSVQSCAQLPQGTSTGDLVEDDAVHATDDRGYVIIDVGRKAYCRCEIRTTGLYAQHVCVLGAWYKWIASEVGRYFVNCIIDDIISYR